MESLQNKYLCRQCATLLVLQSIFSADSKPTNNNDFYFTEKKIEIRSYYRI
jgi:hypothetical protein